MTDEAATMSIVHADTRTGDGGRYAAVSDLDFAFGISYQSGAVHAAADGARHVQVLDVGILHAMEGSYGFGRRLLRIHQAAVQHVLVTVVGAAEGLAAALARHADALRDVEVGRLSEVLTAEQLVSR